MPLTVHRANVKASGDTLPVERSCVPDDLPHSISYHGGVCLSSASRSRDSYQPVAFGCRIRPQKPVTIVPTAAATEEVRVSAITQEKDGPVFKLRGAAEVRYHNYILYADEMTYSTETGEASADGHVVLDGGPYDEHIRASRGTYNLRTESGRFYDVNGTVGLRVQGSRYVLTTSSPFVFTGKEVEKTGPNHYVVNHGTVTTCELPHPKWEFRAQKVVVDAGANAKVYQSTFLLGRASGFLLPFRDAPGRETTAPVGFPDPKHRKFFAERQYCWRVRVLGHQSQHGHDPGS